MIDPAEVNNIYEFPNIFSCLAYKFDKWDIPGTSRPEHMNGSDNILATDRALIHPFATFSAGDHVSTLQQNTVNGTVHADLTKILLQIRNNTFSARF